MAENFEGDVIGFPQEIILNTEETASPNYVVSVNGMQGAVEVSSGGGSALSVGNTLFVDAVHGDDSTATRGRFDKAWETIDAATAEMESNDTVYVRAGTYNDAASFLPDLVLLVDSCTRSSNITTIVTTTAHGMGIGHRVWHNLDEAIGAPATSFDGIFYVRTVVDSTSYTVINRGTNESHNLGGTGSCSPLTTVYFEDGANINGADGADLMDFSAGSLGGYQFVHVLGRGDFMALNATVLTGGTKWMGVIHGKSARHRSISTVSICIDGSGAMDGHIYFSERIEGYEDVAVGASIPYDNGRIIIESPMMLGGTDPSATTSPWGVEAKPGIGTTTIIRADLIKGGSGSSSQAIDCTSTNALATGIVQIQAGRVEGVSAAVNSQAQSGAGTWDISARELVASAGPVVNIAGTGTGLVIRLSGRLKSTYNNAAGKGVTIASANPTVVLDRCTVVTANASAESVHASVARTVLAYGSVANRAMHANVTINPVGELLVDSSVA